ncbi:MAG: M48 family metalloprotease [Flavobacteriales bacterium]|nr:M48 family metalloprotease [Flavobacteriales bacterium]
MKKTFEHLLQFIIAFALVGLFFPSSGKSQNLQKDIKLGEQYSEYVETTIGVYENEELTAYIKAVGDKLTEQMDKPLFQYKYTILATPEPNAFSIPGGHLYITTGMFPFLESEDELACIMAHEIIHANNRHVIKSNRRGIIPGILQIPGAVIGAVVDETLGNALRSPFQRLGMLTHASYSRKQETEADIEGIEIAAKAGYEPKALQSILSRIGRYGEIITGEEEQKDRFATHPLTEDRLKKINKIEPKLLKGEPNHLADDFLVLFDGALAGNDPLKGIIEDTIYYNPKEGFKLQFPDGWESLFMANMIAAGDTTQLVRISFEEDERDPTEAAEDFLENLNPYFVASVLGSEPINIGEKRGHIIAFKQSIQGKTYYGSRTWVRQENLLFNFLAISNVEDQSQMENIVYSLAEMTAEDEQRIKVPTLRIVELENQETVTDLVQRTQSELSEEVIRLINEKPEGDSFDAGERVKLVIGENL